MDLIYLLVLTLSLSIEGVEVKDQEGVGAPTQSVVSRQVLLSGASLGEIRERRRSATADFRSAIPKVVVTALCYEATVKAGTVREIPCP